MAAGEYLVPLNAPTPTAGTAGADLPQPASMEQLVMTDTDTITPNMFATHVELNLRVDAHSNELYRMERRRAAGHPIDEARYAKVQEAWERTYDQRAALDDKMLSAPVNDLCYALVMYRCGAIARIAEHDPARGAAEFRRLADRLAAGA